MVEWDFAVEPPSYLMRISPDLYQQEQDRVARRFEEAAELAEQAFSPSSHGSSPTTERLGAMPAGEEGIPRHAVTNLTELFDCFASSTSVPTTWTPDRTGPTT